MRSHRLAVVAALILAGGCGGDGPPLADVSGVVTRGGKPVPNLLVNFDPGTGRPSWAVTDAEGKFTLTYSKQYKGALIGKHKVHVSFEHALPVGPAASGEFKTAITAKYGTLDKTPLEIDIAGDTDDLEIKLD